MVADHGGLRRTLGVVPDHAVAGRATFAPGCVVDLETFVAKRQPRQAVVVPAPGAGLDQPAVEVDTLGQLHVPVQHRHPAQRHEHDEREQGEVRHQQRQLAAQRRMHDERGEQVERQQPDRRAQRQRRRLAVDRAGKRSRAEQGDAHQRGAHRTEVRDQRARHGARVHGGLLQTSPIQSLPLLALLPFVPKAVVELFEPQFVSTQLPLVAKVRTLSLAFM